MRVIFASSMLAVSLLTASAALADGVLPDVATPVQREQAQSRFAKGRDLMAKKQYDDALVEFRASHDIVASPNTRLEIARCLRTAGKLVAAYAELGRTAIEAKELLGQDNRYQRAYDAATDERKEIEPKLGFGRPTVLDEYPEAVAIAWMVSVEETVIALLYGVEPVVGVVPLVV